MKSPSTKFFPTRSNELPLLGRKVVRSRDSKLNSSGKFVGSRIIVCLAKGETNNNWQTARSAICLNMREQALSTEVRVFERPTDAAWPTRNADPISLVKKIMS